MRFASLSGAERKELWALLALRHSWGIGPLRARRLLEFYGAALPAVEACLARAGDWAEHELLPQATATKFRSEQWRVKARQEWELLQNPDYAFFYWGHPQYPDTLTHIPDPPFIVYYRGDPSLLRGAAVAVVGARDCTREGIAVSAFLSRDLSKAGVTVISGMAKGIDRAAHLAGLEGPGKSIAVLGTGIDVVYPACNGDLYGQLAKEGLILSEFPPGSFAAPGHFPVRNRLISGLSQGVLVVEAARRSGSLITARLALEQGREVFAVPGHTMAAVSEGCRELIRKGAKAVFSAEDILRELAPQLACEADQALRQSRAAAAPAARKRTEDRFEHALATALEVLPTGGLPWIAPEVEGRGPVRRRAAPAAEAAALGLPADGSRRPGGKGEPAMPASDVFSGLDEDERRVLTVLGREPRHIDDIAAALGEDVAPVSGRLTMMEIKGLVRRLPGMRYAPQGED